MMLREVAKYSWIFCIGAVLYSATEVLWRGYTHWSMTLSGGLCLCLMYLLCTIFSDKPVWLRCILCSTAITAVEFAVGCTVNLWLKWNVWDYSSHFCNVLGQICPLYSFLWCLLSLPVVLLIEKLPFLRTVY